MSRNYPLSPVEILCPDCDGYGRPANAFSLCPRCRGVARVFVEGGPSFGCRYTLDDTMPGQIVELGNGDRGRVIRHCERGSPSTDIALIDPMLDIEADEATSYPRETGVAAMSASWWHRDSRGRRAIDDLDPLQRKAP